MDPHYYGIVEMGFTGLVVLGLAGWQFVSITRETNRDRVKREAEPPPKRD